MKGVEAIKRDMRGASRRLSKLQSQKRFHDSIESQRLQDSLHETLKRAEALAWELIDYEIGRENVRETRGGEAEAGEGAAEGAPQQSS